MLKQLKSFCKTLTLSQVDLEDYCRAKRYERYDENGAYVSLLGFHNKIHSILVFVLKIQRWLKKQKVVILKDKHILGKRPIIYAGTHIGGDDIETAFETIKTPCWLLLGDPKEIYRNAAGLMLDLNGVICFDTAHKKDRQIAKERCMALLNSGGNLLMFPEGAWNISQNQLVMHLFPGAVEMAISCNADIVPIAIARKDKKYYVNIGSNISYAGNECTDKYQLTYDLRDVLATLKWEIISQIEPLKRSEIDVNYEKDFLHEIMGTQVATYTVQDVFDTRYTPKGQTDYDEVFEHLKHIRLKKENAFLFRKK